MKLNEFNYDIGSIKGKENHVADFLSRINEINVINSSKNDDSTNNDSGRATTHFGE